MTEILSAVDLVAGFPGHEPVLDGASVRVRRGARMALLGPNGSGKTTLLRCLAGSLKPLRGTIRAEDAAVSHPAGFDILAGRSGSGTLAALDGVALAAVVALLVYYFKKHRWF